MNKKLKKALYMLGFALPIVAIPIITVACGTQTSQVEPTPTPTPEQQPNKEPEIKKMEEVKPDLSVLKDKAITEDILTQDIKDLLDVWQKTPGDSFKIESIKSNKLYSKIIESKINISNGNEPKLLKDELKYSEISDIVKNLKFVDLFDIDKLNIKNLNNEKLNDIKLEDVFSSDSKKLFDSINNSPDETLAKKDSEYDKENDGIKQKIEKLIDQNESSAFKKIKGDLDNKKKQINSEKFKEILKQLKFTDLIDVDKLQEKLTFLK